MGILEIRFIVTIQCDLIKFLKNGIQLQTWTLSGNANNN